SKWLFELQSLNETAGRLPGSPTPVSQLAELPSGDMPNPRRSGLKNEVVRANTMAPCFHASSAATGVAAVATDPTRLFAHKCWRVASRTGADLFRSPRYTCAGVARRRCHLGSGLLQLQQRPLTILLLQEAGADHVHLNDAADRGE